MGIFSCGDFFPWEIFYIGYLSCEEFNSMAKYFSAFIHIYIIYSMDPAQLLHVEVKQASKLYLYLLGHKPKDRFLLQTAHLPVFTV